MSFRYRKSIKVGGARINLSKSGIGYSVGTKGFRVTKKAGGGTRTTTSIPGTGISYVKDSGKSRSGGGTASSYSTSPKLSGSGNSAQKAPRGCLISLLIWCGVWFASILAFAIIGMTIYQNGTPGPLYSLAVLIVPVVVATKVALKPKQSSQQLEPVNVPPAEPATIAEPGPKLEPQTEAKQESEKALSCGYAVRTYHVAGTTFHEDAILSLSSENPDYEMSKRDLIDSGMTDERIWEYEFDPSDVKLIPEPENPHDPNAIKVVVDGQHVGYIKAGSCAHVLKLINEDRIMKIDCEIGGGRYKIITEEYDDEKDKDVYTLDREKTNYFVSLTIRELVSK